MANGLPQSTPAKVLVAVKNAIESRLEGVRAVVSATPAWVEHWRQYPVVQVCPGVQRPDGRGNGAQRGGARLRVMRVTLATWHQCHMDQYGDTEIALTEYAAGLLDFNESVLDLFRHEYLKTADDGFLLHEPLVWDGTGQPAWEEPERGILRMDITYLASFGASLPDATSLTDTDLT